MATETQQSAEAQQHMDALASLALEGAPQALQAAVLFLLKQEVERSVAAEK